MMYINALKEFREKWNMPVRDWGLAYPQFMIYFKDRLAACVESLFSVALFGCIFSFVNF